MRISLKRKMEDGVRPEERSREKAEQLLIKTWHFLCFGPMVYENQLRERDGGWY
jgi:hypothetical protein